MCIATASTTRPETTSAPSSIPRAALGDALEVFIRREDAEQLHRGGARGDDPEAAAKLRIEEREPEAGGLN